MTLQESDLIKNIRRMFDLISSGNKTCKCGAEIWFIRHKQSGKEVPYTERALNHFIDCPEREDFRQPR